MTRYLVEGDIRPGRKSELAARLKDGTLLEGAEAQDRVLEGLREGHASGDTAVFTLDVPIEGQVREELDYFFELHHVVPEDQLSRSDRSRADRFGTNLPEWAGVDL